MTLASKRLKIDLKQKDKAELSPIQNETADGTNFIIEPKQDNTKPMNEDTLKGMSAYSMSRPAKKIEYIQQVGRKGSAFPMVAEMPEKQGMAEEPQSINRAAGPQNRKVLENNPNITQPTNKVSASKFGQEKLMSSIASDPGIPSPQPTAQPTTGVTPPPTTYGDMVQDSSVDRYKDLYAGAGSTPQTSTFGMYDGPSKALVGDQHKLPDHLKAKIEAAPGMYSKGPAGVKIKPKDPEKKKGEAERTKNSVPMPSYGLQNPGKDSYSPSTENKTPKGTRYDYQKDQSIAPIQYEGTGMYGDHAHTKVTKKNLKATERDDAAHMSYLKRDVNYDAKHGGSKKQMLNDEKHISKLAGDLKYDHKKKRKYDNV